MGPGDDLLLQRRLPADAGPEARVGAGRALRAGLGRGLGRRLQPHPPRTEHRRGDLGRRPAAVPGAQRLPGGDLSHLLLQPGPRRRTARQRHVVRGHRGHRPRDRRAPIAGAEGPGHAHRRRGAAGRRRAAHLRGPVRLPAGPALHRAVPDRARRTVGASRRLRRTARPRRGRRGVASRRRRGLARAARPGRSARRLAAARAGGRRAGAGPAVDGGAGRVAAAAGVAGAARARGPAAAQERRPRAGRFPAGRGEPAPAARRGLPQLPQPGRGPARGGAGRCLGLRGRTTPRRGARPAGPRQDGLLLQHQPRVPHAADADAGPARGPGDRARPERTAARAPGPGAAQRVAPAAPGEHAAGLLPDRGRPRAGALRGHRPGGAHARPGEHLPLRDGTRRTGLRGRLRAAGPGGLGRPRDVGKDRPEPAVQRLQVHLARAGHGAPARPGP